MKKLLLSLSLILVLCLPIAFSACKKNVYATYTFDSAIITINGKKHTLYTEKIYSLLDGGKLVLNKNGTVSTKMFDDYIKKERNDKVYATHDYCWKIDGDMLYLSCDKSVRFYDEFNFRIEDTLIVAPVDYIGMVDGWKIEGKTLTGEVTNYTEGDELYAKVVFKKK